MGRVRAFAADDIPQVAGLYNQVFGYSPPSAYFEEVFFRNPWFDETISSQVFEQDDGAVVGFIGVVPRRFTLRGRCVRAAIVSSFMVGPSCRKTLAGPQLLKALFSGPQDLSIGDVANCSGRKIWEAFRGEAALIYSVQWSRVLRTSLAPRLSGFLERAGRRAAAKTGFDLVAPLSRCIAAPLWRRRFPPAKLEVSQVEIGEDVMASYLPQFCGHEALQPVYKAESLKWLLALAGKQDDGELRKQGVQDASGEIIGWYVYHLKPGGVGRVLQVAARRDAVDEVLESLFCDAWQGRAAGVYGRLEPRLMSALANKPCVSFSLSGYWTLVHTRDCELSSSIHRGDVFLTQLDGEWLLSYRGSSKLS